MSISVPGISLFNWSHKGYKLIWNDPVKVSVFNLLIVLVFLHVECLEVIPAESYSVFEALKHMMQGAVVEAVTLGGISVVLENVVVWLEDCICLVGCHLEDDDHEGTHQHSSVYHFVSCST